jgi:para-aminobenzoate synthetase/4-amino-4-deoxychorismate lyase
MRFDPEAGIELLELHLERMKASATELGFSFDRHEARNRIHALCFEIDRAARVRLLLARSGEIALETTSLPEAPKESVDCIALPLPVVPNDWRLRHKSTDRGFYQAALAAAKSHGAYEALFVRDDGLVTEGSFTNLFVERGGMLLTPAAHLGLLPGVLRQHLLDEGRAEEAELMLEDLADGFLIGNATRGLIPARLKA